MTNILAFLFIIFSVVGSGEKSPFWIKGEVKYFPLEGGFYGIVDDKGTRFYPLNLPERFRKDGIKVLIKARLKSDTISTAMWGTPIEILEIKEVSAMKIIILFDNNSIREDLQKGWGLSILIETQTEKILFDTGCDSDALLHNLKALGLNPEDINTIVISHSHWDHTGGLFALINRNPNLKVYVGKSFSSRFTAELQGKGVEVEKGENWREISSHLYITPELKEPIPEQALVLEGKEKVLVIAGCSHPGIEKFAQLVAEKFRKKIWIMGGFHLFNSSNDKIRSVAQALQHAGVERAYPLHCSGEKTLEIFSKFFETKRAGAGFTLVFE